MINITSFSNSVFVLGFDGVTFRFDGEVGHTYNLFTSPYLHVNGLVDKGKDVDGHHLIHTVFRTVAVMWERSSVVLSISQKGHL
jgi:hypothetical protein